MSEIIRRIGDTGFDGGSGGFERYVSQTLFFLAGFDRSTGSVSCNGLSIMDANNQSFHACLYLFAGFSNRRLQEGLRS